MAEQYRRQSALAHLKLAARTMLREEAAVLLCDRGFVGQLSLRGSGDSSFMAAVEAAIGLAPPATPNLVVESREARILWLGPDEWLVVVDGEKSEGFWRLLVEKLADQHAAVADVSEARAVIGLSGPKARETLAHGCSLDLHPRVFGTGQCAQTLLARVPVIIHQRSNEPSFDLYVQRSLAEYLWNWLEDAARPYGVAVVEG
ncbi:MAG TPA: sarcosine oxidase subunit gamma family protein [Alphaproteobacteria bacterium]|nr:sarcosine oxidase subunit gamma family protein [Alphaproteobacteria bacterium]